MASDFINNLRTISNYITRGDMQKQRRENGSSMINRLPKMPAPLEYKSLDENPSQDNPDRTARSESAENGQESAPIPKAPSFRYKNPVVDNNIAYWKTFMSDDLMGRYDELMYILDEASTLDNEESVNSYIRQLKGTSGYKYSPSLKMWINDLEALYYDRGKNHDLQQPVEIMRHQTDIAKQKYDDGHRSRQYPSYVEKLPKFDSPNLPSISTNYR